MFDTQWLAANPVVSFTILLLVSLTVPPLIERLKLPGLVGLLMAGIALGPHGLSLLDPSSETIKLFSDIGKIYLMFVAGLEIDMQAFRRTRNRSLGFGLATFACPLLVGTLVGLIFHFGWNAAILTGSLFASHTLLAYPIVQRLGMVRNEAITVTVGATIFTDIGALLVLAVCVAIHQGDFTWYSLPLQLLALAIYALVVLLGIDRLGKEYFRRTGNDEGNQFLFILLALFLAAVGAQLINIENIVGAFLAGLAVNDVLGRGAVKEKVEFVGGVLFIPFFFVAMGLLIDVPVFIQTLSGDMALVLAVVLGLIGSKFLAAVCAKLIYGYSWIETLTMWSLSLPQVAATLAAALVGLQVGILSEPIFNSVIVLMLVTSVLGPVLTRRFASRLPLAEAIPQLEGMTESLLETRFPPPNSALSAASEGEIITPSSIVVPIYNPKTERDLLALAGLLLRSSWMAIAPEQPAPTPSLAPVASLQDSPEALPPDDLPEAPRDEAYLGRIVPLAVVPAPLNMNDWPLRTELNQRRILLQQAKTICDRLKLPAQPLLRIDRDIGLGICHAAREQDARLIVMGYGDRTSLQARLLGTITDQVLRLSPCPVLVSYLVAAPQTFKRILVPIWELRPQTLSLLEFALALAQVTEGQVTLLYICPATWGTAEQQGLHRHLTQRFGDSHGRALKVKVVAHNDVESTVLRAAGHTDLALLSTWDAAPTPELLPDSPGLNIVKKASCSIALLSEGGG